MLLLLLLLGLAEGGGARGEGACERHRVEGADERGEVEEGGEVEAASLLSQKSEGRWAEVELTTKDKRADAKGRKRNTRAVQGRVSSPPLSNERKGKKTRPIRHKDNRKDKDSVKSSSRSPSCRRPHKPPLPSRLYLSLNLLPQSFLQRRRRQPNPSLEREETVLR